MAFDTSWIRTTALSAAQHAAAVLLTGFGGDAVSLWNVAWHDVLGFAGGTALVSVLAAVVAYKAPNPTAAAVLSVSTGAVQAANAPAPVIAHDADEARGAR